MAKQGKNVKFELVARWRTHFGETKAQMAKRCGVSAKTWERWEAGQSPMHRVFGAVIALQLYKPLEELMMAPEPDEIRALRRERKQLQPEAAELVGLSLAGWGKLENGVSKMHPAIWFVYRTGGLQAAADRAKAIRLEVEADKREERTRALNKKSKEEAAAYSLLTKEEQVAIGQANSIEVHMRAMNKLYVSLGLPEETQPNRPWNSKEMMEYRGVYQYTDAARELLIELPFSDMTKLQTEHFSTFFHSVVDNREASTELMEIYERVHAISKHDDKRRVEYWEKRGLPPPIRAYEVVARRVMGKNAHLLWRLLNIPPCYAREISGPGFESWCTGWHEIMHDPYWVNDYAAYRDIHLMRMRAIWVTSPEYRPLFNANRENAADVGNAVWDFDSGSMFSYFGTTWEPPDTWEDPLERDMMTRWEWERLHPVDKDVRLHPDGFTIREIEEAAAAAEKASLEKLEADNLAREQRKKKMLDERAEKHRQWYIELGIEDALEGEAEAERQLAEWEKQEADKRFERFLEEVQREEAEMEAEAEAKFGKSGALRLTQAEWELMLIGVSS